MLFNPFIYLHYLAPVLWHGGAVKSILRSHFYYWVALCTNHIQQRFHFLVQLYDPLGIDMLGCELQVSSSEISIIRKLFYCIEIYRLISQRENCKLPFFLRVLLDRWHFRRYVCPREHLLHWEGHPGGRYLCLGTQLEQWIPSTFVLHSNWYPTIKVWDGWEAVIYG